MANEKKGLIDITTGEEVADADDRFRGGSFSNSGSLKVDRNGDSSEPTYSLNADERQQIQYDAPILDAASFFPANGPQDISAIFEFHDLGTATGTITSVGTAVTGVGTLFTTELSEDGYIEAGGEQRRIASITDNNNLVLQTAFTTDITVASAFDYGYSDVFKENQVLGQLQYWRVSFNYSGKSTNSAAGVKLFVINPVSGFERHLLTTLPQGDTSENFITLDVATYTDANSADPPLGTGIGGYQLFMESTQDIDIVIKDVARLNSLF